MSAEAVLTIDVALHLIRRLSGMDGYPFHAEGETRYAEVLRDNCGGVEHGAATVDEFDLERCPTIEDLRSAAKRQGRKCRKCGIAFWGHARGSCGLFVEPDSLDDPLRPFTPEEDAAMRERYGEPDPAWSDNLIVRAKTFVNGKTDWDDWNLQCIRQAVWKADHPKFGNSKEAREARDFWRAAVLRYDRLYPETVAAIREGRPVKAPPIKVPGRAEEEPQQILGAKPITQADIDREIAKRRVS